MKIQKATLGDIPQIMAVYADAVNYMHSYGNVNQWNKNYPTSNIIENDIKKGGFYICLVAQKIIAVFYFNIENEPTYQKIDGAWLNEKPYGVIHRIARANNTFGVKNIGKFVLDWCYQQHQNIRIDTHKDNSNMLNLLKLLGYEYCGIIWVRDNTERLAFQKV